MEYGDDCKEVDESDDRACTLYITVTDRFLAYSTDFFFCDGANFQ